MVKKKSLKGYTICFDFFKKNCFEQASGVCSLFASDEVKNQYPNLEEKAKPSRCLWIRDNLMTKFKEPYFPVYLYKYKCGHYSMGSKQHRICIGGMLGIDIPIIIGKCQNNVCMYCDTNGISGILKTF